MMCRTKALLWTLSTSIARAFTLKYPSASLSTFSRFPEVARSHRTSISSFSRYGPLLASNDSDEWEEQLSLSDDEAEKTASPLSKEYGSWFSAVDKASTSLHKKEKSLRLEQEKAARVEDTVSRAQLITSYIYLFSGGTKSAVVQDWENDGAEVTLTLDPAYDSASAEADALFAKARKLKRGSKILGELLEKTVYGIETLEDLSADLVSISGENGDSINEDMFRLVQDRLVRSSAVTGFSAPPTEADRSTNASPGRSFNRKPAVGTSASNLRKLVSPAGCTIIIGRNRRGNEFLSFNMARGDDVWMHARGCPGAHVLIQQRRGSPPMTDACLQLAADLASFYSDARSEKRTDVMAAEPKHLLKPRGAPLGAVKVRQEWRVFTGYPDQVPDEFKLAREESGQSEEYRATDKAKHRKRNREAQASSKKAKAKTS